MNSNVLRNIEEGIEINWNVFNNLRYADGGVVITDSLKTLQILLDKLKTARLRMGLI